MSRVPMGSSRSSGLPYGPSVRARYEGFDFNQGQSAELIAERWRLSRSRLDEFAVGSHHKAAAAIATGRFEDQIAPVDGGSGLVSVDEGVRPGSSLDKLSTLTPVFRTDGVIHAGNASQISDGAAALLVTTPDIARRYGLTPIVRYHTGVGVGSDPVLMLTGPIPATERALKRAGLTPDEIGIFEVNEAFASVPLAWLMEIGADESRLNPLGGAIALGHPLGGSGAILMTRMVHAMRDLGLRYGLQTMCEGGGTANATIVELAG
jgi:acetyl-CoA acyltransferase